MEPVRLDRVGVAEAARLAAEALKRPGAVLLLPTETVYGLVCRADDAAAVAKIYDLKDRDRSKLLGWFVGDWRKLAEYGVELAGLPSELAEKYCPGPITIIARKKAGGTLGFRVPDYPLILEILKLAGVPLAQTSANHSGHPNALSVKAALAELSGDVELAVDGGDIPPDAQGSTVVDATGNAVRVLRPGPISF